MSREATTEVAIRVNQALSRLEVEFDKLCDNWRDDDLADGNYATADANWIIWPVSDSAFTAAATPPAA